MKTIGMNRFAGESNVDVRIAFRIIPGKVSLEQYTVSVFDTMASYPKSSSFTVPPISGGQKFTANINLDSRRYIDIPSPINYWYATTYGTVTAGLFTNPGMAVHVNVLLNPAPTYESTELARTISGAAIPWRQSSFPFGDLNTTDWYIKPVIDGRGIYMCSAYRVNIVANGMVACESFFVNGSTVVNASNFYTSINMPTTYMTSTFDTVITNSKRRFWEEYGMGPIPPYIDQCTLVAKIKVVHHVPPRSLSDTWGFAQVNSEWFSMFDWGSVHESYSTQILVFCILPTIVTKTVIEEVYVDAPVTDSLPGSSPTPSATVDTPTIPGITYSRPSIVDLYQGNAFQFPIYSRTDTVNQVSNIINITQPEVN